MVCSRPFVEPVEHISCGKEFCRSCIEKVTSCPNCRGEVRGKTRAVTSKRLLNPLNELRVICPRCDGVFARGDLAVLIPKCVKGMCLMFSLNVYLQIALMDVENSLLQRNLRHMKQSAI